MNTTEEYELLIVDLIYEAAINGNIDCSIIWLKALSNEQEECSPNDLKVIKKLIIDEIKKGNPKLIKIWGKLIAEHFAKK